MSKELTRILDLDQFQMVMKARLPRAVYTYAAAGSESEASLRANRAALDRWRLVTRVLAGVEKRDQHITLFNQRYASPFGIAPMGGAALIAYQGTVEMARAARAAAIPFILSANTIIPLEEVVKANPDMWFAAYQSPEEEAIHGMVRRLRAARVSVLVVTADVPIGSNREEDVRHGFALPIRPNLRLGLDVATHPGWVARTFLPTLLRRGQPHLVNLEPWGGPGLFSRKVKTVASHEGLNWSHIRLLRRLWEGMLVIKGILSPADVALAKEAGADGVILSNHGGRQLDYAVAPMDILEEALDQAGPMPVMLDGGFRRGTDIVKALALGAAAVFIGRPFLFAAAYAGERGVSHAIHLLRRELDKDMALLGTRRLEELAPAFLRKVA
ncbi:alpha-hydroxy acid oxidase [Acidocella sp.]|uniref:alpha-hydroxy acid oxidase n=1 Tax=Acidocella sp. TaxID=50710 RepID=UPI0026317774|nr:alpha-hydroxy acid oxidase [Acidocella sp.]